MKKAASSVMIDNGCMDLSVLESWTGRFGGWQLACMDLIPPFVNTQLLIW
jgi:hypothetical protein